MRTNIRVCAHCARDDVHAIVEFAHVLADALAADARVHLHVHKVTQREQHLRTIRRRSQSRGQ
jgi:hypothetical protein